MTASTDVATGTVNGAVRVNYAPEPFGMQFSLVFQGVSDNGVLQAMSSKQTSRVHEAVAAVLGKTERELFRAWKPQNVLTLLTKEVPDQMAFMERVREKLNDCGIEVIEP